MKGKRMYKFVTSNPDMVWLRKGLNECVCISLCSGVPARMSCLLLNMLQAVMAAKEGGKNSLFKDEKTFFP